MSLHSRSPEYHSNAGNYTVAVSSEVLKKQLTKWTEKSIVKKYDAKGHLQKALKRVITYHN